MKSRLYILPALIFAILTVTVVSCGNDRKKGVTDPESLPEEVRPVAIAIISDSPAAFSAAVTYPIERPYPLRDIPDSAAMVDYYPVMVDDSLKKVVKESPDSLWNQAGWRGWTLDDGSWIWIDNGKVYAVNYLSKKEHEMLDSLRKEEISSLEPALRDGWIPVLCVVDTLEGNIFRIDSDSIADNRVYRLAGYRTGTDLSGAPSLILYGSLNLEGSMGNRFYHFTDSLGNNAEYTPDVVEDDSIPEIEVIHQGNPKRYKVKPTYWLDHIGKHRVIKHPSLDEKPHR